MKAWGTVKVTVRIFLQEKPLFRGEAAYHNGRRISWAGDRGNFHPCWKEQPWQQTLASCLNPWYDASHFSNCTNGWMMLLNASEQFRTLGIQIPKEMLQHEHWLECLYMLNVSVILQSIWDINCTQDIGFLLIFFYCRIIHILHND